MHTIAHDIPTMNQPFQTLRNYFYRHCFSFSITIKSQKNLTVYFPPIFITLLEDVQLQGREHTISYYQAEKFVNLYD